MSEPIFINMMETNYSEEDILEIFTKKDFGFDKVGLYCTGLDLISFSKTDKSFITNYWRVEADEFLVKITARKTKAICNSLERGGAAEDDGTAEVDGTYID